MSNQFIFSGYASIFNKIDYGKDIIMPHAFNATLKHRTPQQIALLWQHNSQMPIGVWRKIQVNSKGLKVQGVLTADVQQSREAAALMQLGGLTGLSIGFTIRKSEPFTYLGQRYRLLHAVDLIEISLVTFPMNPHARISGDGLWYGKAQVV